ncbi:TetR/AcrR family transcriptional regulator [Paenarthrobacter sp. NPDC089714]|uniref:TetR/AcrR family transcriptional regulator n=1 Tax=Paenarthrobacter sp. NPDC089714 TaxID=3364377 RepID=UPI0037FFDBD9
MSKGQTGARGPYVKGVQRRQEILDRTLDVVAHRGIEATSLRAIGEAIGISHGTLLHYFESREALLLEVLRERDTIAQAALSGIDQVFPWLESGANNNAKDPAMVALYTTLLATAVEAGNESARAFFAERFKSVRADLSGRLRAELAASGRHPEADLDQVASLIMAAFDGLQIQWLLDRDIDIAGTIRLIERVL